jgi:RNA polymerase sigma factor (sigma-70 family)
MIECGSVTKLIRDLPCDDREVSEAAARRIWERYFVALLGLARQQLNVRVRRREDEEDVLQSMYKSFYRRQRRGDFDLASRDDLWKLLVTITLRKARNVANRHHYGIRDVHREQADSTTGADDPDRCCCTLEQIEASSPTPAEAAILNEELEQRLQALGDRDPELRQIALLKLEGYTNGEIAKTIGRVERTVERKLDIIRRKWSPSGVETAPT